MDILVHGGSDLNDFSMAGVTPLGMPDDAFDTAQSELLSAGLADASSSSFFSGNSAPQVSFAQMPAQQQQQAFLQQQLQMHSLDDSTSLSAHLRSQLLQRYLTSPIVAASAAGGPNTMSSSIESSGATCATAVRRLQIDEHAFPPQQRHFHQQQQQQQQQQRTSGGDPTASTTAAAPCDPRVKLESADQVTAAHQRQHQHTGNGSDAMEVTDEVQHGAGPASSHAAAQQPSQLLEYIPPSLTHGEQGSASPDSMDVSEYGRAISPLSPTRMGYSPSRRMSHPHLLSPPGDEEAIVLLQRRQERNRVAARRSREKKKEYLQELENTSQSLIQKNLELVRTIRRLHRELASCKGIPYDANEPIDVVTAKLVRRKSTTAAAAAAAAAAASTSASASSAPPSNSAAAPLSSNGGARAPAMTPEMNARHMAHRNSI